MITDPAQMENGYHLYDFKGQLLREEHIERFNQFLWRPRPPTMLSKDEQKAIRKNLREYSKVFDEEDEIETLSANKEVVDARMRILDEWKAWRQKVEKELEEDREDAGFVPTFESQHMEQDAVVEELVEEVVQETEEEIN